MKARTAITTLIAILGLMLGLASSAQAAEIITTGSEAQTFTQGIGMSGWIEPSKALFECEGSNYSQFAEIPEGGYKYLETTKGLLVTNLAKIPANATNIEIGLTWRLRNFPSGGRQQMMSVLMLGNEAKAEHSAVVEPGVLVSNEGASGPWYMNWWRYKPEAAEVNNPAFGVVIYGQNLTESHLVTLGVDCVQFHITYSVPLAPTRRMAKH